MFLRPLPYPDPERLIFLSEGNPELEGMTISYPNLLDWQEPNQAFEEAGVYNRRSYNLNSWQISCAALEVGPAQVLRLILKEGLIMSLWGRWTGFDRHPPPGAPDEAPPAEDLSP